MVSLLVVAWGRPERTADYDYNADDADDDDADDVDSEPRHILSTGQKFEVNLGATVKLPCKIDKPDDVVVQWTKENAPLFLGNIRQIQDVRYHIDLKDWTLTIENTNVGDSSEYSCRLIDESSSITHTVNVKAAGPLITRVVPQRAISEEKEGSPFTFMCEVAPQPGLRVHWVRANHDSGARRVDDDHFSYDRLTWRHSGNYTCVAEDLEGQKTERTVILRVQSSPDVHVSSHHVNSAEKYESELICEIHCSGCHDIHWEKDGVEIKADSRHYQLLQEGHKHFLRILATKKSDFGQYYCVATNKHGTSNRTIYLQGEPLKPILESVKSGSNSMPIITWKVHSKAELLNYEIIYKRQQDDEWITVNPEVKPGNNGVYTLSHHFTNLLPDTYAAKLRAKNVYGYSELSEEEIFSGGPGFDGDNTLSDYLGESRADDNAFFIILFLAS
ncbi:Hypothetical protein NTJ_02277 [Nesidiocoris tenuis]|uniref:Ig-like domain-containing protein n=1 Tax=Nesidiocoris tenuis TaxID=355587 RepID=A0ABN7AAW7_9HEMI|nr:Hypothetical protein NTJ_02277 [Nesidiocoris tenuis]